MNAVTHAGNFRTLDEMEPWNDSQQGLEVISVIDEAPGVKTFTFRSETQSWFRYKPGQFITLQLPAQEGVLNRTYTLSSSPSRPHAIAVTVKAQPGSVGTQWMFDNVKSGSRLKAMGPYGDFTLHKHPAAKYLFISAGSGITPMMSMLRWLYDCAPGADVVFVNCARAPEEIVFRRELELLGSRMHGLSLRFLVEQRSLRESWSGFVGRIDSLQLAQMAPDYQQREVFCCGPDPFMRTVQGMLKSAQFDMSRYHQESFGAAEAEVLGTHAATGETQQAAAATLPIRFMDSNLQAECQPGKTVLQTARASGVRISAACESGICGTCRVRKISGEVTMSHNGGILDEDIAEGYILACCSRPTTALEIEA